MAYFGPMGIANHELIVFTHGEELWLCPFVRTIVWRTSVKLTGTNETDPINQFIFSINTKGFNF